MPEMREKQFQSTVLQLAKLCGWEAYHTYDSRRSQPGFPDLVLAKPKVLLFAELKVDSNKLTLAQRKWATLLGDLQNEQVNPVYYRLWMPEHQEEIEKILTQW